MGIKILLLFLTAFMNKNKEINVVAKKKRIAQRGKSAVVICKLIIALNLVICLILNL
jgi:flagellar biogenesis protein FliO